ncbi:MAG TPA: cytochrome c3 family protein [Tepidisphaeraceae bacterium]|nr:cytochrome c3 family protein [Tepidisphaeraceae bacterium]
MRYPIPISAGAILLALCLPLAALAQAPSYANGSPNIANSPHNLNNIAGVSLPQGQICIACHTPHGASQYVNTSTPGSLLWNHNTNPGQTYSLYIGTNTELDNTSRLCLSCHDGAIAVDAYGGGTGTTYMSTIVDSNSVVGGGKITNGTSTTDLTNTHPLGVAYPGVTGKTGSSYSSGGYTFSGGTWNSTSFNNPNNFTGGVGLVQLGDGVSYGVGCTSCHTPHDYTNKFLVEANTGSQICLTCHIK